MGLIADQTKNYYESFVSLKTIIEELSIIEGLPHSQVAAWLMRELKSDQDEAPKLYKRNPHSLQVYEVKGVAGDPFAPINDAANNWTQWPWEKARFPTNEWGFWCYQIKRFLITVDAKSEDPGLLILPPCLGGPPFPKPAYLVADDEQEPEEDASEDCESDTFIPADSDASLQALEAERDQARQALAAAEARATAAERERDELREQLEAIEREDAERPALEFLHPSARLLWLVAEVQRKFWPDWKPGDGGNGCQDAALQWLKETHGLSGAEARAVESVAAPISRDPAKKNPQG